MIHSEFEKPISLEKFQLQHNPTLRIAIVGAGIGGSIFTGTSRQMHSYRVKIP
ncbi:hypothetical protein [Fluviispira multicolorata]|uniref:hypothetical protein n=1 Tax=Fluviispira multicolorata TaxID=2654512 RepID=UPI001375B34C|nr:hypothetical protein [Fluviispira multicolorata]